MLNETISNIFTSADGVWPFQCKIVNHTTDQESHKTLKADHVVVSQFGCIDATGRLQIISLPHKMKCGADTVIIGRLGNNAN